MCAYPPYCMRLHYSVPAMRYKETKSGVACTEKNRAPKKRETSKENAEKSAPGVNQETFTQSTPKQKSGRPTKKNPDFNVTEASHNMKVRQGLAKGLGVGGGRRGREKRWSRVLWRR